VIAAGLALWWRRPLIFLQVALADFIGQLVSYGLREAIGRPRPPEVFAEPKPLVHLPQDGSFPSGHASAAFATASVIERHLGARGAWPTFAIAGYVAMSRLHDNRHYLSDVLFGGALGVATGWTVVGRHGRSNYAMMPLPVRGGFIVSVSRLSGVG